MFRSAFEWGNRIGCSGIQMSGSQMLFRLRVQQGLLVHSLTEECNQAEKKCECEVRLSVRPTTAILEHQLSYHTQNARRTVKIFSRCET